MLVVFATIAPIFLIIVAGFCLRRTKLFPAEAWPPIERITYYVLFPSLLFVSLATAKIDDLPIVSLGIGVVGTPALMALLLLTFRPAMKLDGPGFTSLTQGAIRFNTYIGIPLVIAFYGPETIALGAVFIAFMVPFINVVSVWVLAKYGSGKASTLGAVKEMTRNPLIIACVAGITVNVSGLGLATPLATFFRASGPRCARCRPDLCRCGPRPCRRPGGTVLGRPVRHAQACRHAADRARFRAGAGTDGRRCLRAGGVPRPADGPIGLYPCPTDGRRCPPDGRYSDNTDGPCHHHITDLDFVSGELGTRRGVHATIALI